MDRLLTRAHGLFEAGAGSGGGEVFAAGGGGGGSVPAPPDGGSGLGSGVAAAGGVYEQSQAGVSGLDADSGQTAGAGGAVADQGRAGAGVIRDQARTVAAATAPLGNSAAGARLVVAAMDEHLAAMQRQLDTTTEQNKVLAARLRQLAEAYRGAGGGMGGGMPMAGMGGLGGLPMGGGAGGGGLGGLSGLAALPASLISGGAGSGGGREPGGGFLDSMLGHDGRGSEPAQRAVAFAESKLGAPYVWGAQGPGAFDCSGLVKDSYAHAGISLPRETYDMIRVGTTVDRSQIRAGDLVFSNFSGRGPEHVQLAVSPMQVIEAPTPGGHVQYSSLPHGRIVVKRVV